MKIMIITAGYLPAKRYGGPVTSLNNLVNSSQDNEFYIICHNHDLGVRDQLPGIDDGWNRSGNSAVMYLEDGEWGFSSFHTAMCEIVPDLLYLQSIFDAKTIVPALKAAREENVPILIAPRGELCKSALQMKKWKKLLYLFTSRLFRLYREVNFQSTSEEESHAIAHYLGVLDDRINMLPNVPGLNLANLRHKVKEADQLKVLFISRINRKKNLSFALNVLQNVNADIFFDFYGPDEDCKYLDECLDLASNLPNNIKASYKGPLDPTAAKTIFLQYDCFLFPTLSENFGHVICESLLAGCPVVISRGTTPWDDVNGKGGFAIDLSNPEGFSETLERLAGMDEMSYRNLCHKAAQYAEDKISRNNLIERYDAMFFKSSFMTKRS